MPVFALREEKSNNHSSLWPNSTSFISTSGWGRKEYYLPSVTRIFVRKAGKKPRSLACFLACQLVVHFGALPVDVKKRTEGVTTEQPTNDVEEQQFVYRALKRKFKLVVLSNIFLLLLPMLWSISTTLSDWTKFGVIKQKGCWLLRPFSRSFTIYWKLRTGEQNPSVVNWNRSAKACPSLWCMLFLRQ